MEEAARGARGLTDRRRHNRGGRRRTDSFFVPTKVPLFFFFDVVFFLFDTAQPIPLHPFGGVCASVCHWGREAGFFGGGAAGHAVNSQETPSVPAGPGLWPCCSCLGVFCEDVIPHHTIHTRCVSAYEQVCVY